MKLSDKDIKDCQELLKDFKENPTKYDVNSNQKIPI